ncbi:thiamine pyrophosphate-dependent enzyme [Streptomyces sp. NPDC088194]|uniref:thiamine pyrophosphate-dependent enzyme n=1 Tax=Streptomyces sp. NPDC088194 TaxID=3154931 RepID=UPI00344EF8D0
MPTVRDATFDVLRLHGLTTMFANPGSTEVPFLTDLPEDLHFVLALHEGSVVGAATGWAIARDEPALVLLHTTAGLGNAVGALATARANRAPLVVLVGQQDRRHLAQEPFLAGRLEGLAGDYPVSVAVPARAQDVPGAVGRAVHAARAGRGPALVIVPMDDWAEPAEDLPVPAPAVLRRATTADPAAVAEVAALAARARNPALVVGAGADSADTWAALTALAERLNCPVWQEPFGARAGFPQDHRLFAGHLPAARARLREALAPYDLLLVVGAPFLRQYPYGQGPLAGPGTRVAVVTDDPDEAHRAPADLAVVTPLPDFCDRLARRVPPRDGRAPDHAPPPTGPPTGELAPHSEREAAKPLNSGEAVNVPSVPDVLDAPRSADVLSVREALGSRGASTVSDALNSSAGVDVPSVSSASGGPSVPDALNPTTPLITPAEPTPPASPAVANSPGSGGPLRAAQVLAVLAGRLPVETVIVEETPSSRPDLHALLPARRPLGFLSAAMGGLGFAMPAAVGLRMGQPRRPVVAVVGDGSSLYQIQSLWTAAHYGVGVVFVVLANGRYAIMDRLAEQHGGKAPWPAFGEVSVSGMAVALGCPARTVTRYPELLSALDEIVPTLYSRTEPVVLEVVVVPDPEFRP